QPVAWAELDELGGADRMRVPDVLALLRDRHRDPWRALAGTRQRLPAPAAPDVRRPSSRRPAASAPRR
ncbi:MAG TPA: hypothetical protein VFX50_15335, partial [Gemmatimonadales bacterium]|nr:hypothetical protein [Gemmatimonadales bacterium]